MNKTVNALPKKNPPRRRASLNKRKARAGWIFVLPFVLGVVFLYLPIILDSICYSFYEITPRGDGYSLAFMGFEYYSDALKDTTFTTTLLSGIEQLIIDTPMILIFSLFIAVVLNQKMLGRAAFRAIFFIPVVLSTGLMETINAADIMQEQMGSAESGGMSDGSGGSAASEIVSAVDIARLFEDLKVGTGLVEYVVSAVNNIYNIVNRSGVQMLIFLAGLQSISPAIYEASSIEGATAWETFWKITFPMMGPMILVNAVYTIIDSFTSESNVVMSFIKGIYNSQKMELATAMSWIYFLIIMAIIGVFVLIASSFVFYQKRN